MAKKIKFFFGKDLPLGLILLNWVALCGFVGAIIASISDMLVGTNFITAIITGACGLVLIAFFILANGFGFIRTATYGTIVVICLVMFPMLCVTQNGIFNGMPVWFVVGILITFFMIRTKICFLIVALEIALYSGIIIYYSYYSQVAAFDVDFYCSDTVMAVALVGICMGIVIRSQTRFFEKEIQKNEEQKADLEQLRIEAEKANVAKSDFLANMSHEIRTPMNAVLGLSEVALHDETLSDSVRINLEDIQNSGNYLLQIINNILDFSKIEAGEMSISNNEYNLTSLVYDLTTMVHFRLKDKPVEFIRDVDYDIPDRLLGDETRVKQVLMNILSNAAKYTEKGTVKLHCSWRREGDMAYLTFTIADTGQGIQKDDLENLFTSFDRKNLKQNRTIEGTGLGLAICKQLLELMGGSISCDSIYGVGTRFVILLPQKIVSEEPVYGSVRRRKSQAKNDKKAADYSIVFPQAKILLVDDSQMNLKVAKGLLGPYKCNVDMAGGGAEALALTEQNTYDLILLDHMMPEIDGLEVVKRLHEREGFHTPIVALTANAVVGVRKFYLDNGFDEYISKPIVISDLEAILRKFLKRYLERLNTEEKKIPSGTFQIKHSDTIMPAQVRAVLEGTDVVEEASKAPAPEKKGRAKLKPRKKEAEIANDVKLEEASAPDAKEEKLEEKLVDFEEGLDYSMGNQEFYIEAMEIYLEETRENMVLMDGYLKDGNMPDYATLVHALKSNSRIVGAMPLGDVCYELEMKSKENDLAYVQANHEPMKAQYDQVCAAIEKYIAENK